MVDRGVYQLIGDQAAPLLLAGGDYLLGIYREVNTYSHLSMEGMVGNPEVKSSQELHEEARVIVEPALLQKREDLVSQYHALREHGQASESLAEVIPAAHQGRVRGLFVARDREIWGIFDPELQKVKIYEEYDVGAEDLLDLAVVQTFIHGGDVYVLPEEENPGGGVLSAVFRY